MKPKPKFRKDYKPSDYLIRTTELTFELSDDETIVSSKIDFYRNNQGSGANSLFLNGVELELISISIDDAKINYKLEKEGIWLYDLPESFVLRVKNRIHPENNTSLNGLYQSSGNFCTQCEAHGFRQITYYLDRPDVLSVFTTHITADKQKYPILLSNGNLIKQKAGEASWHDPAPKPCYLFALVAGNLSCLEDSYTTHSGREVALKIFVEPHNIDKTEFAMHALKRSFAWDEKRFGLEYDLDIYMIVAVDDFNMGAMENKGLNIFNSTYVLANQQTATDNDFINIESVIGHEYFHNWTGNRVTCRDWFQLSLKEGLTVFRDQEFTSDLHSRSIKRIDDVIGLRTYQFAEDAGPMAHPVRPESYIEMNNFYTATVYEKGAEVIRMIHTLLGEEGFQKGMQLYFKRHDGDAVTIDDFVSSMEDANDFDLSKFMSWYAKKGTPEMSIETEFDESKKTYRVKVRQLNKANYYWPLSYGLFNQQGEQIDSGTLVIDKQEKRFTFENIDEEPTPSWLRSFSAPIKLKTDLDIEQRAFLIAHDTDAFNRWDNAQELWLDLILKPKEIDEDTLFTAIEVALDRSDDHSLLSEILSLPSERLLQLKFDVIDVFDIRSRREAVVNKICNRFENQLTDLYGRLKTDKKYDLSPQQVGNRSLKNICLYYLTKAGDFDLAYEQFTKANCMTDRINSFSALLTQKNNYQDRAIDQFYQQFNHDVQVMDKWFAVQSIANVTNIEDIQALMKHQLFNFNNPNRLRSVIGSFAANYVNFHQQTSYEFFTDIILKLNDSNPQIGARLVGVYNHWKRYREDLSIMQKTQLEKIASHKNLSNNIYEIVEAALK